MRVKFSIVKALTSYLVVVLLCSFTAGMVVGGGYADMGEPKPDVSEMGSDVDGGVFGGDFIMPIFYFLAQKFTNVGYALTSVGVPYPLLAIGTMATIAYFGIYRVGGKGWVP